MYTFDDDQPEEFIALLRNFKSQLTEPARLRLQAGSILSIKLYMYQVGPLSNPRGN